MSSNTPTPKPVLLDPPTGRHAGAREVLMEQKALVVHAAFEEVEASLAAFKHAVMHGY